MHVPHYRHRKSPSDRYRHGHCDHAGGAVQFPNVYLNEADWDLEKRHATIEHRIQDVFHGWHKPEGITEDMLLPQRTDPFLPLTELTFFSLGNVTVRFIAARGHTRGSMIPVIPEDGAVILGDDCNENALLHFPESVSVQEYKDSLSQVIANTKDMSLFLNFHGTKQSDPNILKDEYDLCEQILKGTDSRIPMNLMGYPAMSARPMKHPGFPGNILYNPDKLVF